MFYFFHGTTMKSLKNILKTGYILPSSNLESKYLRTAYPLKYIYTNIYTNGIPLKKDQTTGFGQITLIISPEILNYKTCYFNIGWMADINKNTIIMNNNIDRVLKLLKINYKYPYILTHEALFKEKISVKFVGIVCVKKDELIVRKMLNKYNYKINIYNKFPKLLIF